MRNRTQTAVPSPTPSSENEPDTTPVEAEPTSSVPQAPAEHPTCPSCQAAKAKPKKAGPDATPVPAMRAGWYYRAADRAILHSAFNGAEKLVIGYVPKVDGLVTARSEDGKHTTVQYRIQTVEGPRLVTEDELDHGTWAGKIGMPRPSGKDAIQAFATMIRLCALDAPEIPSQVFLSNEGNLVMPDATAQELGYRVTRGTPERAMVIWSLIGYHAARHPVTALILGAAFGAPLTEYLTLPCHILNLVGHAQSGKSTTQIVQACLYGSIKGTTQKLFESWDTSPQGLPQVLRSARFLPLFREEFSTLRLAVKAAEGLLSAIVGGANRTMGGKDGHALPGMGRFHSMVGSSSNRPLRRNGQTEDLAARLYEIKGPFWPNIRVDDEGAEIHDPEGGGVHISKWLKNAAQSVAGWPFEWAVTKGFFDAPALAKWSMMHAKLCEKYSPPSGGLGATIAEVHMLWVVGAYMLGEILEMPEIGMAAESAAAELLGEATVRAEAAHLSMGQKLWDVLDAVRVNSVEFPEYENVPTMLSPENKFPILGFVHTGKTGDQELWVIPARLEEICRRAEIENMNAAIDDLKALGILIPGDGRNDRRLLPRGIRQFIGRIPSRMYAFSVSKAVQHFDRPEQENADEREEVQEDQGQQSPASQAPAYEQGDLIGPGLVEKLAAAEAAVLERQAKEASKEASNLETLEAQQEKAPEPSQRARTGRGREVGAQMLQDAVEAALEAKGGDIEAATAVLVKRAIQDGMALLAATRVAGRYEYTAYPAAPEILQKKVKGGADQIWESRPKWVNKSLTAEQKGMPIQALDANGAFLSSLKTHLPIGALKHSTEGIHDPKRSGLYEITPPEWEHSHLPSPLGNRDVPGKLWVPEPTIRQLLRLSKSTANRPAMCEAPVIHQSYTSGSSENLLEDLRCVLRDAREKAIREDDTVMLEYVKAMYSKLVSTMGESNANHEIRRADWMHIIRAQAFANLWGKALKAHEGGLIVVKATGTDELHVIGDWRSVFTEGRGVSDMKAKGETYTLGGGK